MVKKLIILVIVVGALGLAVWPKLAQYRIDIPPAPIRPAKVVLLEQNWTPAQRAAFHHMAQGTRLVPFAWFKALEQPCFSFSACDDMADPVYLSRFGFIPSDENPDKLPIGFARHDNFHDPITKKTYPVVGFTCAACHTGEIFHGDHVIRIEGGPAMVDLGAFQKALGLAMGFTEKLPWRYSRFEKRVLGDNATAEQKAELKKDIEAFLVVGFKERDYATAHGIYTNLSGFGRTDALTRIGNQVFAVNLGEFDNFQVSNASVRFPQIWDAPWLDWVQYNSSIADPLVRNIGEALGVRAMLNPVDMDNSVDVAALAKMESMLAGPAPYQGLTSPKWPAEFGKPLDEAKVKQGASLYQQRCQGCHLPPVSELLADREKEEPRFWQRSSAGMAFLKVTNVNIKIIGTDPRAAMDFRSRTALSGPLNKGILTAAEGLELVTQTIAANYFDANKIPEATRLEWAGYRKPGSAAVRDKLIYKARPLNGIWAVAPYLHNGSVPSLYLLLSPREDRPTKFWTGGKRFDPVNVGYEYTETPGAFAYDTTILGNSNHGHEFTDGPRGNGVIGSKLTAEERWALIEYLKSL